MTKNTVSCKLMFKGLVQGVGFRFTAKRLAQSLQLNGFVRNLANGNVEVRLEGEKKTINSFIDGVQERMSGYIKDMEVDWIDNGELFTGFQIRF